MNFLEAAIGGANCRVTVTRAKEEEVKKDTEMEIDQTKVTHTYENERVFAKKKRLHVAGFFFKVGDKCWCISVFQTIFFYY